MKTSPSKPLLTLTACSLALAACKVGPEYEAPELSIAETWTQAQDPHVQTESTNGDEWWGSFEDPTMAELIAEAHAQNLPLRIAGIRILEARAELGRAMGSLYPQTLQAFGSYTRNQQSEGANPVPFSELPFSTGTAGSFDNYQVGAGAMWELDLWGRFQAGIDASDALYLASVAEYDHHLVSLSADVAVTYVTIRTLEERLSIARRNVEIQESSLQIAESRFANGATSELDVAQARALLSSTRALIPPLLVALTQARNGLAILLGRRGDQIAELLGEPGLIPTAPRSVAVGIPADLLRRRPDIRMAELQAIAQCKQIGVARADLLPKFGIGGAFGFSAASTGDLFGGDGDTGLIGPYFTWDFLNFGRIEGNVRVQDARFQTLLVHYQSAVLRAQREVEDSLAGFLGSLEESDSLLEAVAAAERAVELALAQYSRGSIPYSSVLSSQQFLTRQQDLLTRSRGAICRNLIGLFRALGGGWQVREEGRFLPAEIEDEMGARTDWGDLLGDGVEAAERE